MSRLAPLRAGLWLAAVLAVHTTAAAQSAPTPSSFDTAAVIASATPDIEGANAAWIPGLDTRDAARITAAYSDSALFIGPDGTVTRGRVAITAMYAARLPRLRGKVTGGVHTDRLTVVSPDLLYESGRAWMEMDGPTAGAPRVGAGGAYLTVWRRERDGHWHITRNLSL